MNSPSPYFGAARIGAVLFLIVLLGACGGDSRTADSAAPAPSEAPATQAELPPDHPPVADPGPSPGASIAPPTPGSGQGSSALSWTAPAGWIAEAPSNSMRRAQYRVPGEGGDGECVVYYFGPGQGGDAVSNAERWADQFSQPDGTSSRERMTSERFDVAGIDVLLVEVAGTFNSATAMGGQVEDFPGYMLLGAIAEGTDANWFFKFTGPESTIRQQQQAFGDMIRSLRAGG